jgi:uncharacterized protein with PIN domain
MDHSNGQRIVCEKCQLPLANAKTKLTYQGVKFEADLLRCPKCRQAFVPEELAVGKMHELEITLEDK